MNVEDYKKYNIFENILQKFNQKYVALPPDEIERNNKVLLIIDKIVQKMKSKSPLFDNLYQNKYYGGSYYDGLKVGKPCEYDLDCVLRLPKIVEASVEVSDRPGFVHVVLKNLQALWKQPDEASKYKGLDKFLDEHNFLSTKKVKSWMESLMASVWTEKIDGVSLKRPSKSGPALTIKVEGVIDNKSFEIDIDFVPCFTFFEEQWPAGNYRRNTSEKKREFFVVPKSPNPEDVQYWRLSFQEQEREKISGNGVMKPTIRLIKKLRDRYQHKIASYYIKTVFLWEVDKVDKTFWGKSLSYVFITMLRKYGQYVSNKCIPYYWNEDNNLIGDLSDETISCITNKINNILKEIERNYISHPYNVLNYFLIPTEYDLESFKQEVPLSKKYLKQVQRALQTPKENRTVVTQEPQLHSVPSSVTSSFEEINRVMVTDSSNQESSLTKLEGLCADLVLGQKRITALQETVVDKINGLGAQIKRLEEMHLEETTEKNELMELVSKLNKKVDDLTKTDTYTFTSVDSLLLPANANMLQENVHFPF